jgi:glutamate/tyrosine decarboxylase-like PLP-dependent enzyme
MQSNELNLLSEAFERLKSGFASNPALEPQHPHDPALEKVLFEVADRLHDNFPYFDPLYAGQMLKPPHAIARLAYSLSLWINPNNHALDGGRASSAMEKEAVAELAQMFGWQTHLGHLTSGGTMANLEALWVAGQLAPAKVILASGQAHYTHERISRTLGLVFEPIASDRRGKLNLDALKSRLSRGNVGTVVVTIGTTATGSVDPLAEVLQLREQFGFRIHADAAYGGYFCLIDNLRPETRRSYECISQADSLVIDPHKHGLQPYGCGCVLFRDPAIGRFYKHNSPYTYFSSLDLHLGEISLECSRPGAAAVALWATQKLFPLVRQGKFSEMLSQGRAAALEFHTKLATDPRFIATLDPELDIVVWAIRSPSVSESSVKARKVFEEAAKRGLHLALAKLPVDLMASPKLEMIRDDDTITCLRSALMKPEHHQWLGQIWEKLIAATETL